MKIYRDYLGSPIRLTDERLVHIILHPEIVDMLENTGLTLNIPIM